MADDGRDAGSVNGPGGARRALDLARRIVEACPLPLVVSRLADRSILYESPANNELFGETRDEKASHVGVYDVDPSQRVRYRERLEAEGAVRDFEIRFRRADGSEFVAALSADVIEFDGEKVVISGAIDVTDRVEREANLRRVLDACPIPVTLYRTEDGSVLYETPAAEALFGPRDPDGQHSRWASPDQRERHMARLRTERRLNVADVEFRRADGEVFHGALSASLIDYHGTEIAVATVFDLTERLAAEAELARQREALHQSEKLSAMGQLLAGVSHELNNPLSVVVGQSMLQEELAEDETVRKRARRIAQAAERCARIVRSFLAMARQEPRERRPVDPNELIEAALELTAYPLRTAGIELRPDLAPELPEVRVDRDQIIQVFTNLVVNAQQALEGVEGARRIDVASAWDPAAREVVVTIADTGPGVPAEIRSRIFEPFFTTKPKGSGTGIGLALCHRILETNAGRILLRSGPGGGAEFVVRLRPARDEDRPAGGAGTAPEAPVQPLSILVIDDEADVLEYVSEVLGSDGHRVATAASGEAAFDILAKREFDIILSDVRMPGVGGRELLARLGEVRPDMVARCAFVTGDVLSPEITDFLETGGHLYVEKPATPDDLREVVRELARRSRR